MAQGRWHTYYHNDTENHLSTFLVTIVAMDIHAAVTMAAPLLAPHETFLVATPALTTELLSWWPHQPWPPVLLSWWPHQPWPPILLSWWPHHPWPLILLSWWLHQSWSIYCARRFFWFHVILTVTRKFPNLNCSKLWNTSKLIWWHKQKKSLLTWSSRVQSQTSGTSARVPWSCLYKVSIKKKQVNSLS